MKIEATLGNPVEPGLYCARQWYGYRILEWDGAKWWYPGKVGQWPESSQIEAHFGPLPVISKDYTKPPLAAHKWKGVPDERLTEDWEAQFDSTDSTPPVQEYDL